MVEEEIWKNFVPSEEDVENENVEAHRQDLIRRYWKHRDGVEIIDLQLRLMVIMKRLGPTYFPDQSNNGHKEAENKYENEDLPMLHAFRDNTCQPTTYTYKFFYLLSAAFLAFISNWLTWKYPHLVTTFIVFFLYGLFPFKNIMNVSEPTKSRCDKLKPIASFIWERKTVYDEDYKKMKSLRNYAFYLAYFSPTLCIAVNLVIFIGTLSGTCYLFDYLYPLKELSEPPTTFWTEFIPFLLILSILFAYYLKFICFRWMFRKQLYPKIIRWFF